MLIAMRLLLILACERERGRARLCVCAVDARMCTVHVHMQIDYVGHSIFSIIVVYITRNWFVKLLYLNSAVRVGKLKYKDFNVR